jgi:hypothetical protein
MMRDPILAAIVIGLFFAGVAIIGAAGAIAEIRAVDALEAQRLPAQTAFP